MCPEASNFNSPTEKQLRRILIICLALVIVFGIGCVIGKFLFSPENFDDNKTLILKDCRNDSFEGLVYDNSFIKFFIIRHSESRNTFGKASSKCQELNSTLWEVKNKQEWIALTDKLVSKTDIPMDIWLNGKVEGTDCPSGAECLKPNATRGDGLPVRWQTTNELSKYSRLYRGETSEKKCIRVEETDNLLWTVGYCDLEDHVAVCVKRNCKPE